jgi:Uma2 family endonuclease
MPRQGSPRKLTYGDYLALPDDGLRRELIGGTIYMSPSLMPRHKKVALRLVLSLGTFVESSGLGELYFAPLDIVLSPHDVVQPDVIFVAPERLHIVGKRGIQGAPDLVVEILSPATRRYDQQRKYRLYEHAGVREYWLLDPATASVTVHRLAARRYWPGIELSAEGGDDLTSPLLPGWSMPLAALRP